MQRSILHRVSPTNLLVLHDIHAGNVNSICGKERSKLPLVKLARLYALTTRKLCKSLADHYDFTPFFSLCALGEQKTRASIECSSPFGSNHDIHIPLRCQGSIQDVPAQPFPPLYLMLMRTPPASNAHEKKLIKQRIEKVAKRGQKKNLTATAHKWYKNNRRHDPPHGVEVVRFVHV